MLQYQSPNSVRFSFDAVFSVEAYGGTQEENWKQLPIVPPNSIMRWMKMIKTFLIVAAIFFISMTGISWISVPAYDCADPLDKQSLQVNTDELEQALAGRVGWYRLDSGVEILVTWAAFRGLRLIDFQNRRSFNIYFELGSAEHRVPRLGKASGFISFLQIEGGLYSALRWQIPAEEEIRGQRMDSPPYVQEELRYSNGDTELFGTLLLPNKPGPHPAIVYVHGSGKSDRDNLWIFGIADHILNNGIAVFVPDKRGSGKSGGDWCTADYQDLASDSAAAIQAIPSHTHYLSLSSTS